MAINITDGFNLNYAAPVDYRMVVANSTARLALTYKYDGLKVFQLDTRVSYIWNPSGSGNWNIESYNEGKLVEWNFQMAYHQLVYYRI